MLRERETRNSPSLRESARPFTRSDAPGTGVLRLPNLGTNCAYRFAVSGFGAGIQVGVSRANAAGVVANMKNVSELAGNYTATQGEATLIAGSGSTSMRNQANAVVIGLNSRTEGLALGVGGQG